jgi:hypothetical protein
LLGVEQRYEVDLNGYHSPLAATEIKALYRAGAIRQKDPSRPVGQEDWQTVNELFPTLKYDSAPA